MFCKDYNPYDLQVLAPIYKNRNGIYAINDHYKNYGIPKVLVKRKLKEMKVSIEKKIKLFNFLI